MQVSRDGWCWDTTGAIMMDGRSLSFPTWLLFLLEGAERKNPSFTSKNAIQNSSGSILFDVLGTTTPLYRCHAWNTKTFPASAMFLAIMPPPPPARRTPWFS